MNKIIKLSVIFAVILSIFGCGGAEERKAAYMEKANQLFEAGNYEKAKLEYKNVLQIDPKDVESRYKLGRVLEEEAEFRQAMSQYLAVLNLDENHVGGNIHAGQIYLLSGDAEQALTKAETALANDPGNPNALALRGGVKAKSGDTDGAIADGLAAIEKQDGHKNGTSLLVALYMSKNQPVKAMALLNKAIEVQPKDKGLLGLKAKLLLTQKDYAGTEKLLKQIIDLEPDEMLSWFRLAGFQISQKQLDKAESTLREAIAYEGDDKKASAGLIEFLSKYRSAEAAEKELLAQVKKEPDNAELQFNLARQYQRANPEKSVDVLKSIIDEHKEFEPEAIKAKSMLAMVYMGMKKTSEASEMAEAVLKENPKDNNALTVRGSIALLEQKPQQAIDDFRAALGAQPDSVKLLRLLARSHYLNGEHQLARESLEHAAEVAPKDPLVHSELAEVHIKLNQSDLAIEEIQKVLAISPDNAAALETLYKLQAAKQDWKSALSTAEKIKEAFPDSGEGNLLTGIALQQDKDFSASIDEYNRALEKSPDAVQPLAQLVRGYLAQDKADEALARVDKVIQGNPENYVAMNMKGEILLAQKKLPEARKAFRESIAIKKDFRTPYLRLATSYAMEGQKEKIVDVYQEGIKSIPDDPVLITGLATVYEETGNTDGAVKLYQNILDKNPDAVLAANNLAMIYADYFDDAESLSKAQKLVEKFSDSENPAFLDTVGWVDFKLGNFDKAITSLEKAVDKIPDEPVLRYHLGMAYLKSGNNLLAKDHLSRAVNSPKDFKSKSVAREALSGIK